MDLGKMLFELNHKKESETKGTQMLHGVLDQ